MSDHLDSPTAREDGRVGSVRPVYLSRKGMAP